MLPDSDRPGSTRRIAVVPAYNEEPTVAQVLDKLSYFVDELVVVDDGSTDRTRDEIEAWLPRHDHAAAPLLRREPRHVGRLLPRVHRPSPANARWRALARRPRVHGRCGRTARPRRDRRPAPARGRREARRPARSSGPVDVPAVQASGQWTALGVGNAVGRSPSARRRVRLPHLPARSARRRARRTTAGTSTRRRSKWRLCSAGSATACATTCSCRYPCIEAARAWWMCSSILLRSPWRRFVSRCDVRRAKRYRASRRRWRSRPQPR